MNSIEITDIKKGSLHKQLERYIFAIPKFQRDFVWNIKKAIQLLDSIYNNYPIGTIMIWDSSKRFNFSLNQELTALPPYSGTNARIYYIEDGQQRLSVIYRMFRGDTIKNSLGKIVDFGNIYFALDNDGEKRFYHYIKADPESYVKVCDILSSYWRSKFTNYPNYKIKEIRVCREKLLGYKVFLEKFFTSDLKEVRETFIRINSLGTTVSSADKAFSRASKFDLKNRVYAVINAFPEKFRLIHREALLNVIPLVKGMNQIGERALNQIITQIERSPKALKIFNKEWKTLSSSYGTALDHLIKLGVINNEFLPSENMLLTLTTFFYHNKNAQPSARQRNQIKKWFWYTGIASRYSGRGYLSNILSDFDFFKKLAANENIIFKIVEKLDRSEIRRSDYSANSSLNKTFFCLLASKKPRYLDNGDYIPLSVYSVLNNKKNKHHIFPKSHLIYKEFPKKRYNSIANICYLVWKENSEVGSKPPLKYLRPYKRKSFFHSFLRSHLIPLGSESGLWLSDTKRGYNRFLNSRAKVISHEFEKLAGAKIFEN